tara:strand:- start:2072 stop:3079 length:1008 start_codon:yes stop_codon:yes gene_type:complete
MLLIAFGTRPEWIKIKPVIDAIDGEIPFKLLFTGQHTSLVDESIENYPYKRIEIDDQLGGCRLDAIVCSILDQLPPLSDISGVMVQGDTTSAFAVALAAFHRQVPVIHLEAGLRTFDKDNPYPEEFNRCAISALADVHLCPTITSAHNLRMSLGREANMHVVGNTVLDNLVGHPSSLEDFVLVTLHRRENHENIAEWFETINELARTSDIDFVLPIHPNPNVVKYQHLLKDVKVIDPLPYADCIDMVSKCRLLITDSGGLQEESSFFGKRCIVCRKITERLEGIGQFAFMCGSPSDLPEVFRKVSFMQPDIVSGKCPYGDGNSAQKVAEILRDII